MTMPPTSPTAQRRTLHAQFVRRLLWPLVLAFALAAFTTALVGYRAEKGEQATQRQQTLTIFAQSLTKPLWDCDGATVRGIVDTLAHLPIVRGVRLQDVCASEFVEGGSVTVAPDAQHPDRLLMPVIYRDDQGRSHTVGQLMVQFHPFTIANAAIQNLWQQLAIFCAMLAVVLVGAAWVFRRIIGQPLDRLRLAIVEHRTVLESNPPPTRFVDELTDVTQAYDGLVRELQRLARHDPLTGLGNRTVLEERLAHAVERSRAEGRPGYVLLLDLDGFKAINDTHGHAVGDLVLQAVAQRLQTATRSTDTVARLGGDEFVIVAHGQEPLSALPQLLARVRVAVETPIECQVGGDTLVLRVGASIGAASFPDDGQANADLLTRADEAMYEAKQHRHGATRR